MRIRTIKPEFWQHQIMASLPEFTRLLAVALLNYCDDDGYFMAAPQSIRGAVFPFMDDSRKIQGSLTDLSKHGYLRFGKLPDGRDVGHVVNFLEQQVINRPQPSRIKELAIFTEHSVNAHGMLTAGMEGNGTGKGNKEQGKEGAALAKARQLWPSESWLATPRSTVPHAGIVDAILLAEFGRQRNL